MKKRVFFVVFSLFLIFFSSCNQESKPLTFKQGNYTTSAKGMNGKVVVSVGFSETSIETIDILEHTETTEIGEAPLKEIPRQIIETQSLSVDAITGATITSQAIVKAVSSAVKKAGVSPKQLLKKKAVPSRLAVEKNADVVIIGGGGAGLSAAVSAAQNGASVLLIEKTGMLGGNTIRSGGPYNAVDEERQAKLVAASEAAMKSIERLLAINPKNRLHQHYQEQLERELEAYQKGNSSQLFDSVALHILQTYDGGDYEGKIEFIEKLCSDALLTAQWLEKNGLVWRDSIVTVPGGLWPRGHVPQNAAGSDYIKINKQLALDLGVEILLNCKGESLIEQHGRIVGVKGTFSDGTPITLNAKKAVIIASGGFAASKIMRKKYNPLLGENLKTTNSPANVGEGIVMAEAVNANLVGMEHIQCLPLGNPQTGALNGWVGGMGVEFYYQINKEGKRFMAEDGRRDVMTKALLEQTDSFSYVIADSHIEFKEGKNLWGDNVDQLVAEKKIFRADTIEALAKQIQIDPKVLRATHDQFNEAVEKGKDPLFGRTLFRHKMDKAPFYASPRMPTVHHTMGGIEINLKTQVLDKKGAVIPGLYAAGEVTGGIHGKNRLGGNALVDIHLFGKIAGENAAKEQP